jgi:hypothetical protein
VISKEVKEGCIDCVLVEHLKFKLVQQQAAQRSSLTLSA